MDTVGIAASAAGVIGVSGVSAALRFSRSLGRQSRFLRLHRSEPFDMVLPTSERTKGGLGIRYLRTVTAMGNMRGATLIAQAVGGIARSRQMNVAVSEELETPLSGDLVVLGLPGKNVASRMAIESLAGTHPELGLAIRESRRHGCQISLNGRSEDYAIELQEGSTVPTRDLAIIVLWVNPLARQKRRLLLCAGFTAYGTEAAAAYLVHDILEYRYSALRKQSGRLLPSLFAPFTWPCFALLLEVRLIADQVVETVELAFAPLGDPGAPPWR